jgi:hypothetical protein
MKVKIIKGGGYQDTVLDVEALPRSGETIRFGRWKGVVYEVSHVPLPPKGNRDPEGYRDPDDPDAPVAELVVEDVVQIRTGQPRR